MEDTVSVSSLFIGLASGGIVNTGVLIWLALHYVSLSTKVAVMARDMHYLRREVSYANGRAEPDDEEEEPK